MDIFDTLKRLIAQITQAVIVLIPLAVVLQVLFGGNTTFFDKVVDNLIGLINQFGDKGLVGLIAFGIVIWIFSVTSSSAKSS